jgi:hypothetical protein
MNKSFALIGLATLTFAAAGFANPEPTPAPATPETTPASTTTAETTPAQTEPTKTDAAPVTTPANTTPAAPKTQVEGKPAKINASTAVKPENVPQTAEGQTWQNNLNLTENHVSLKQFVGVWACEIAFDGTGAPTTKSAGTMVNQLTFGGRYITTAFAGDMFGQNFQGTGTWGFNTVANRFESTWIDTMSTGIAFETGNYDAANKTFTMTGNFDDTQTGQKKVQKTTYTFDSNDKYTMNVFEVSSDGAEKKAMTIIATRRTADGTKQTFKKTSTSNLTAISPEPTGVK